MSITEIKIRKLFTEGRLKAIISLVLNDCIAVHEIKIIQGDECLFVAMPCRKEQDGTYRDIIHPIGSDARNAIENAIIEAYNKCISALKLPA